MEKEICRSHIEKKLYRYRSYNNDNKERRLDEIANSSIHLSLPSEFNDPFDSTIKIDENEIFDEIISTNVLTKLFYAENSSLKNSEMEQLFSGIDKIKVSEFIDYINNAYPNNPLNEKQRSEFIADIRQNLINQAQDYKIACFSETNYSVPMWAYYADDHKGICLEYDFTKKVDKEIIDRMFKVHYSNNTPKDKYGI